MLCVLECQHVEMKMLPTAKPNTVTSLPNERKKTQYKMEKDEREKKRQK